MPATASSAAVDAAEPFHLDEQTFQNEIRIAQSMHLVAQAPTLVFGNIIGALIGCLIFIDYVPLSLSALWLLIPLLCLPMVLSWLKLRGRPRPASVTPRRIRTLTVYSTILGIAWAVVPVVFVANKGAAPPLAVAMMLAGMTVLCMGAVAAISPLPAATIGYFLPLLTVTFVIALFERPGPYNPWALLSGLLIPGMLAFLNANWRSFKRNVAIAAERAALAAQQTLEVERRARAEAAVKTSEERLRAIIEALPIPVAIFRLYDAQTVYANRWVADLVGLTLEEFFALKSSDLLTPQVVADMGRRLRSSNAAIEDTVQLRRKDGQEMWVRLSSALMTYGGAKCVLTAAEDITLRREYEERLRTAKQAAEDANKAKSQFLANMSHELRTPLNAILGYTELMADGIYGDLPAKAADVLERVQSNGRHLLDLINDVLDLSKIEAGQFTLANEPYDMGSVVQSVIAATEGLAKSKGIGLRTDVSSGLLGGIGDERRLTQVLLNLVGNALKFTDAGTVEVSVRCIADRFDLRVRDTGPGIAAEDQQLIFEEFRQVDNTSTRRKGGTGLGLAITRRIVEMHGGTLRVESAPGKGATFIVDLPVQAGIGGAS
ncbi:MAG: PAS domain S-box protein [Enhydrobacter sp.]|nr:MAG: PAS domain S-box protein [Enhydrobacter sp.]